MSLEGEQGKSGVVAKVDASTPNYGIALIDRLTKSVVGLPTADADLNTNKLIENFGVALHELHVLRGKLKERCSQLETKCREEERAFHSNTVKLRDEVVNLHGKFNSLDTQVNVVSGKLVHLGDQLDRKNLPRKLNEEARASILEFYKFIGAGGGTFANVAVNSPGDEDQLIEAATRIKNLTSLCLELPDDERFLPAKQRVTVANQQLEMELLSKFRRACSKGDSDMKKRIADVLNNTKGQSVCAEIIIDEALQGISVNYLDLKMIIKRLADAEKDILVMFPRPDAVVLQLISTLFMTKIKVYLDRRIVAGVNPQLYLDNLYKEYQNMDRFLKDLSDQLTLVTDPVQLSRLFGELFNSYLSDYIDQESTWLASRLSEHLEQFYSSGGHQKQNIKKFGLADMTRDLKAKLGITASEKEQTDYDQSLLSEEVAVNIIEDTRQSVRRCLLLSKSTKRALDGRTLFDLLSQYLMTEHVDYGVTLALHGLQAVDTRNLDPDMVFFSVVHGAASIFHFFTKTVDESFLPLVSDMPAISQEINTKRQAIGQELEAKLHLGTDRCVNIIIGRVQQILAVDQRKTDFRCDTSTVTSSGLAPVVGGQVTLACQRTVNFFSQVIQSIQRHLDGVNLKNLLAEFGMRFHRTLVDHFYGFTFSDTGGFVAMQDVTAYREVAKELGNTTVDRLFDVLLKLMNLMTIKPENVSQVMQDYLQLDIPKELLSNFIQLRQDYKTAKLQLDFK